jgi:hypothetical protein
MTEHLGGSGSPAEGLSGDPKGLVIGLEYALIQGSCNLFSDDWRNVDSQEFDRIVASLRVGAPRYHMKVNSRKVSEDFVDTQYLLGDGLSIPDHSITS